MMTITENHHYPAAVRVARAVAERIERGEYEEGAWIPTERALASEFDVDRSVVRAALADLERRSLITREPGRRPWVTDRGHTLRRTAIARQTLAAVIPHHPIYPSGAVALLKGIHEALRHAC